MQDVPGGFILVEVEFSPHFHRLTGHKVHAMNVAFIRQAHDVRHRFSIRCVLRREKVALFELHAVTPESMDASRLHMLQPIPHQPNTTRHVRPAELNPGFLRQRPQVAHDAVR